MGSESEACKQPETRRPRDGAGQTRIGPIRLTRYGQVERDSFYRRPITIIFTKQSSRQLFQCFPLLRRQTFDKLVRLRWSLRARLWDASHALKLLHTHSIHHSHAAWASPTRRKGEGGQTKLQAHQEGVHEEITSVSYVFVNQS